MSRPAGQVSPRAALTGLAALLALLSGVVWLSMFLLPNPDPLPALPAPQLLEECPALRDVPEPVPVTSAELFECPDIYDGLTVRYEGEVVAEVLDRGSYAWAQLNDDPYGLSVGPLPEHRTALGGNSGISVVLPRYAVDLVDRVGSYDAQGTLLRVVGVFFASDPLDDGLPSIHARVVDQLHPGREVTHPVTPELLVAAALSAAVALVFAGLARAARRR